MNTPDKSTVTFRIDNKKRKALDHLAKSLTRDRSAVINEAISAYLDTQAWQEMHIKNALEESRSSNALHLPHSEVDPWLQSWGSDNESEPPKAKSRRT